MLLLKVLVIFPVCFLSFSVYVFVSPVLRLCPVFLILLWNPFSSCVLACFPPFTCVTRLIPTPSPCVLQSMCSPLSARCVSVICACLLSLVFRPNLFLVIASSPASPFISCPFCFWINSCLKMCQNDHTRMDPVGVIFLWRLWRTWLSWGPNFCWKVD